jgi:hypothetical protein
MEPNQGAQELRRAVGESDLELTRRHVLEGRRMVAEQRIRIQRLREQGLDLTEAASDLHVFEQLSAMFEAHLLLLEGAERPGGKLN